MKYREMAFNQIDSADLPPTLFKAAIRLLLAVEEDGHLKATKQRVCELCSTVAWGTARRLLGDLKEIGILHYSTDGEVYINFHTWPAEPACSEIDHPGSNIDHPGSEIDHTPTEACSEIDHPGSEIDHGDHYPNDVINIRAPMINIRADGVGGKRVGWVGNDSLDPDLRGSDLPTPADPNDAQTPAGDPDLSRLKPDQRWAYTLLLDPDLGIMPENAVACVRWHTAAYVVRQVAAWWMQRDTLGAGVLVWRLMNPGKSRPGAAPPEFLASDLYCRHYPLDDYQAERWDFWKKHREYADVIIGVTRPDVPPDLDALLDQLPTPVREVRT